jgi:hypothetical protein
MKDVWKHAYCYHLPWHIDKERSAIESISTCEEYSFQLPKLPAHLKLSLCFRSGRQNFATLNFCGFLARPQLTDVMLESVWR